VNTRARECEKQREREKERERSRVSSCVAWAAAHKTGMHVTGGGGVLQSKISCLMYIYLH